MMYVLLAMNNKGGKDMKYCSNCGKKVNENQDVYAELERISKAIENEEGISYGEISFLQNHQEEIKKMGDIVLAQWADIPEEEWNENHKGKRTAKKSVNEISDELANKVTSTRRKELKNADRAFAKARTKAWKDTEGMDPANRRDAILNNKKLDKVEDRTRKAGRKLGNNFTLNKLRNNRKAQNESLSQSILRDAHSVLTMNESEAGEMTTWQFTARGFSKAMINKQPVFGSDNIRCIIHENANGKVVGTAIVDYYMSEAQVEEAIKKALAENGFRASNITNLVNLF